MSARADPRAVFEEKKRTATLLASLAAIHKLCQQVKERQHSARHVHTRLHQVFLKLTSPGNGPRFLGPRYLGRFTAILEALHTTLKRHIRLHGNIVRRVLHHRLLTLQLRALHHELSAFLREIRAIEGFPMDWRPSFETSLRLDEEVLHSTLMTVVKSTSFLAKEYLTLSTRQQMEVLLSVRYELGRHGDRSPLLEDCLRSIYRQLVKLFGWDLSDRSRRLPRWFLPLSAIEVSMSRGLLVRDRPTYRGEMALDDRNNTGLLKRHLVVMKCFSEAQDVAVDDPHVEETLEILDAFMAMYADISHPHLLRLRGANYVAGSPFLVRDYAIYGTLSSYLTRYRSHNRPHAEDAPAHSRTVWKLLAEACAGLRYLHEDKRVAHGGLKGANLLVNHHGRVVLSDVGVRYLRRQLHPRAANDDDFYVRWMAPEMITHSGGGGGGGGGCSTNQSDFDEDDDPHPPVGSLTLTRAIADDTYALGMCILEVLSENVPWAGLDSVNVRDLKRNRGMHLPPRPDRIPTDAWQLIQRLCAADPDRRMSLREAHALMLRWTRDDGEVTTEHPEDEISTPVRDHEPEEPPQNKQRRRSSVVEDDDDTDSLSSYKTTQEIDDEDLGLLGWSPDEPENQDHGDGGNGNTDMGNGENENVVNLFDSKVVSETAIPLVLQTNCQIGNAIDFLERYQSDQTEALQSHLELLRAFAKMEATSIQERGGIRVLQCLLCSNPNPELRDTIIEIYTCLVASNHVGVADAMVDLEVVETILTLLAKADPKVESRVHSYLLFLLDLLARTDRAKRAMGAAPSHVEILERHEELHHRSIQEIKSVLARFKQTEGNELLKEGFHALAIKKFTEAIALDRKRGIYYADRSLAYCHAAQYREAAEDAERCVRYNPFDVQGYLRYGIAMKYLKRYREALAALHKGREVNPTCEQVNVMMKEVEDLYMQQRMKK